MDEFNSNQIIITVTGKDKVGIVSAVSNRLASHQVNIEDIKQSVMQDFFVMFMLVEKSNSPLSFKEIKDTLTKTGKDMSMEIWVQKKQIFDKMHTI